MKIWSVTAFPLATVFWLHLLLMPVSRAEEPPDTGTIAERARAAFRAGDEAALAGLAARDQPDPFLVVEALLYFGEPDTAAAFARAAARPDTEKLPEYVASRRGEPYDPAVREALNGARESLLTGDAERALATLAGLSPPDGTVSAVSREFLRAVALEELGQREDGIAAYREAAGRAAAIGWRAGESRARARAAGVASALGEYRVALEAATRLLELECIRGNARGVAGSLADMSYFHLQLQEYPAALEHARRALDQFEKLGDDEGVAIVLTHQGRTLRYIGDYARARTCLTRSASMKEELGHRAGLANTLFHLGEVCCAVGDYAAALDHHGRSLAIAEEQGDPDAAALALSGLGWTRVRLGEFREAVPILERALAIRQELGDRAGVAVLYSHLGGAYMGLGDYLRARSLFEESLAEERALGRRANEAVSLANLAGVHRQLGSLGKSLSGHRRVLALYEELGDRPGAAIALGNLGILHADLGDYPEALACLRRSLEERERIGDTQGVAAALQALGNVHRKLGDHDRAFELMERALALSEEIGDRNGAASAMGSLSAIHLTRGDVPAALTWWERSMAVIERTGNRHMMAAGFGELGLLLLDRGEYDKALAGFERAEELYAETGNRLGACRCVGNAGVVWAHRGELARAEELLRRAAREARRLRSRSAEIRFLTALAWVHLEAGEPARALMAARESLREVENLLGGLAEEEGAATRGEYESVFALGAAAAARLGDPAEILTFLESGRAGSLLESLGGREALRFADLPEELRKAEEGARVAEARARIGYASALDSGDRKEIRTRAKELDLARELVREVAARIQRDAKKQAGLLYPRAATLLEIEDWLPPDTSLVTYGLCHRDALALVLTADGERIVELGNVDQVSAAMAALDLSSPGGEQAEALTRLAGLLVEPLDLGDEITTVLVSPEGPLCYAPFGALFRDRAVAVVPSGTTYALLREEERESGEGVLALGDPDYEGADPGAQAIYWRGRNLAPLPGSRAEAEEVGTIVLLGAEASEAGLREAVTERKRWRSVHLACHGLIDAGRPTLSSLALSGTGDDDGFLTALEVLRMEIPADLAVLSACETAKGKVVKGEGIVGLTRAFMYAGAPRVLCSLWKVDDEATKALMVKFYELWNPPEDEGLGAAEALRQAQAFVRSHEEWKHPHYWAAWVLWGLP